MVCQTREARKLSRFSREFDMDYKALCAFGDADIDMGDFDDEKMPIWMALMSTQKNITVNPAALQSQLESCPLLHTSICHHDLFCKYVHLTSVLTYKEKYPYSAVLS